jgi:AraC-like DNA-binding protein
MVASMEVTTLLVRWANFEADALTQVGFRSQAFLRASGYPVNPDPGWSRLPWAVVAAMWKAAEKQCGDPNLGLHAAEKVSLAEPGFVAHAMLAGADLRETFGFLEEYQRLCIDGRIVSVERRRHYDAIRLHAGLRPAPSKHHPEFLLCLFRRACHYILGDEFRPAAVHLRRTVSRRSSEFEAAFGCPIYWDQAHDELHIEASWMTRPSPYAQPEMMATLRARAVQFLKQYTASQWMARVEALVERMLSQGDGTLRGVAENLGISPRTLQRRLADEGRSFDDIRESVRRALAMKLVAEGGMTMADVAGRLGFSEPRAFRRAFQRWTGTSPSEHARRAKAGRPSARRRSS